MTTFEWKGLDAGQYVLSETTTPAGYNTISDINITVTAEHKVLFDTHAEDFSDVLTSLNGSVTSGEVTMKKADGSLTTDVENKSGLQLPSTGGMGTTLFYVVGSVLVLVAGVLLVSKKRMNNAG